MMTETERRALLMTILARIEGHTYQQNVFGEGADAEALGGEVVVKWDHVERVLIQMSREPMAQRELPLLGDQGDGP